MTEVYIPYETVAHAEADDILLGGAADALDIAPERQWILRELLASAIAQGIDLGFAMSDFIGNNPNATTEAYAAGVAEGKMKG